MARRGRKPSKDAMTLQMALVGYEIERKKIEEQIREIQGRLGRVSSAGAGKPPRKKRVLSPEARRRIAAAQKRRWAEHRKNQAKG